MGINCKIKSLFKGKLLPADPHLLSPLVFAASCSSHCISLPILPSPNSTLLDSLITHSLVSSLWHTTPVPWQHTVFAASPVPIHSLLFAFYTGLSIIHSSEQTCTAFEGIWRARLTCFISAVTLSIPFNIVSKQLLPLGFFFSDLHLSQLDVNLFTKPPRSPLLSTASKNQIKDVNLDRLFQNIPSPLVAPIISSWFSKDWWPSCPALTLQVPAHRQGQGWSPSHSCYQQQIYQPLLFFCRLTMLTVTINQPC